MPFPRGEYRSGRHFRLNSWMENDEFKARGLPWPFVLWHDRGSSDVAAAERSSRWIQRDENFRRPNHRVARYCTMSVKLLSRFDDAGGRNLRPG